MSRHLTAAIGFSLCAFPLAACRSPLAALQIQDNSFLLEEAYNQEAGVVQHISTFARWTGGDWDYTFTQEWPLGGIRHQLSYTLPLHHGTGDGTGLGDLALNYRYQLAGNPRAQLIFAPRLSLLLPTGDEARARGAGAAGAQINLPLTRVLSPAWVTHWNAGLTAIPSARNASGQKATTSDFNLGASAIWLTRSWLNLLVEAVWATESAVVGSGQAHREGNAWLSPGFRVAWDLPGGLQVVPGAAYVMGLTSGAGPDAVFLYLSFEHPFKQE